MIQIFIDETTSIRIGVDKIRQWLRPLSAYGNRARSRMNYYTPGQESQLTGQWQTLAEILSAWEKQPSSFHDLELTIHMFRDIRGLVRKCSTGHVLEEVDLFEVKRFAELTCQLQDQLDQFAWSLPKHLRLPIPASLMSSLQRGGDKGRFYLDEKFAPKLAQLRKDQREKKQSLTALKREMQQKISRETGKNFNHLGVIRVGKLEGDLLEQLSHRNDLLLAAETYTEVEFVIRDTVQLISLRKEINQLEDEVKAWEYRIRKELSNEVAADVRKLLAACRRIGSIDLLFAMARLGKETGWCVPTLEYSGFKVVKFVNPVMNEYLAEQGRDFQPFTIELGATKVTVITGANMGGKSVALKSVGLATAMAQLGLLVPAQMMSFAMRDFIYYSQQDEAPEQGLSTFGAEIKSLAEVLSRRNEQGLFLLDEPARGTNPWEGGALVKALATWLSQGSSLTFVATHFPGLSAVSGITHLQVAGLAGVSEKKLANIGDVDLKGLQELMDYSLVPGKGEIPKDALKVALFLGLEREIIDAAADELGIFQEVEMQ